jgi:hypothetical protein
MAMLALAIGVALGLWLVVQRVRDWRSARHA